MFIPEPVNEIMHHNQKRGKSWWFDLFCSVYCAIQQTSARGCQKKCSYFTYLKEFSNTNPYGTGGRVNFGGHLIHLKTFTEFTDKWVLNGIFDAIVQWNVNNSMSLIVTGRYPYRAWKLKERGHALQGRTTWQVYHNTVQELLMFKQNKI